MCPKCWLFDEVSAPQEMRPIHMQWLLFDKGGRDGPYPVAAFDFTAELYLCRLQSTGAFQTRYSKKPFRKSGRDASIFKIETSSRTDTAPVMGVWAHDAAYCWATTSLIIYVVTEISKRGTFRKVFLQRVLLGRRFSRNKLYDHEDGAVPLLCGHFQKAGTLVLFGSEDSEDDIYHRLREIDPHVVLDATVLAAGKIDHRCRSCSARETADVGA